MITDFLVYEGEEEPEEPEEETTDVALFVESRRGKTVLQYRGHRYRKAYKSRNGTRWNCSLNKNCGAFIYLNDNDEILMSNEDHDHPLPRVDNQVENDQNGNLIFLLKHFAMR